VGCCPVDETPSYDTWTDCRLTSSRNRSMLTCKVLSSNHRCYNTQQSNITDVYYRRIHYTMSKHRRNLRGMRTPHFWAYDRKNSSDFPSSSAHVSPYNIQENVWRLRLCPRNRVHRRSQRGSGGTNIYVKVICLVIVNVNVTQYVPQKCQI